MAIATTNKLPEFATVPQNNTFDEEIIDKSSKLEEDGFIPNTTIRSSQMNTYMKMMIESLRGIVDGLYRQAAAQGDIKANSTAQEWQNYIQRGLTDLITKTRVSNAVHADKATNVDAITDNDSENNANVKFSIGDQRFTKTVNNVANANACSGNAGTATKLQTPRTINISGDATGTAQSFDGTANVTIPVDVKKSAALDSTNVGDATHPVYFDTNGKPVKVNQKIANDTSGKSDTAGTADEAIKLQTPRNIALTGDVTGNADFDGSGDVSIVTSTTIANAESMVTNTGDPLNVGGPQKPIYFSGGKPTEVIMYQYVHGVTIIVPAKGEDVDLSGSDRSRYLAHVIVTYNTDTYISALAVFNDGKLMQTLHGAIQFNTGSASATTLAYSYCILSKGSQLDKLSRIEFKNQYLDGHIEDAIADSVSIAVYKICQIS